MLMLLACIWSRQSSLIFLCLKHNKGQSTGFMQPEEARELDFCISWFNVRYSGNADLTASCPSLLNFETDL